MIQIAAPMHDIGKIEIPDSILLKEGPLTAAETEVMRAHPFAHGARHALPGGRLTMFDSFHCSRYNTNTRRLTRDMFFAVFRDAAAHLGRGSVES